MIENWIITEVERNHQGEISIRPIEKDPDQDPHLIEKLEKRKNTEHILLILMFHSVPIKKNGPNIMQTLIPTLFTIRNGNISG